MIHVKGQTRQNLKQKETLNNFVNLTNFFQMLYPRLHSSWSYVFKTFSRRLQNVLQKRLQNIFKTSSKHLQDVFKTFSRRLQNVLKTSWRRLAKTSSRHLQDAFETFWRRLQDVLKISWRRFCKTSWRRKKPERFQDAFKTYHQIILFLLTSFQDVFKTYSQRFWGVLQRRLSTEGFA